MSTELYWYNNAIIYSLDIGVFKDSNGDGIGDFQGAIEKLDYLEDLGINCIWLLPFFESSEKDNGYDVEDYYGINRSFGNFDDFLEFKKEAEKRNMRIIMDLVVHHTSDHHPWFKLASHNRNSKYHDYYIWDSKPPVVSEENIFAGEENSTWKYSELIDKYYHHKFYDFEPDLNLVNPDVQEEIKEIIRYWMGFGVSGFRLDAATHLFDMFKEKGDKTPGKVMEEFHDFLSSLKKDALFLAEADVKPSKISEYIGKGNRMGMLFNFLLNNNLFLAMAREKAAPIIERIKALPKLPANVQWANFIRNLDELDLEQLSKEEREEVFLKFGPNKNMQAFGRGIRRRIAPMISANVKYNKMLFCVLFALPGVPVIAYGDEIGMGDNLVYKGRRALRTPMQWDNSKNGGFSQAATEDLDIKPVSEGIFSYHYINVEDQKKDPDSLFNEIKNFIKIRKAESAVFSEEVQILDLKEEEILGISYNDDMMIFINISRKPKILQVPYDLQEFNILLEDEPYGVKTGNKRLDIKGYGYRWFKKKA